MFELMRIRIKGLIRIFLENHAKVLGRLNLTLIKNSLVHQWHQGEITGVGRATTDFMRAKLDL